MGKDICSISERPAEVDKAQTACRDSLPTWALHPASSEKSAASAGFRAIER